MTPHVTPSLTKSETSEPLKEALLVIRVSVYDAHDDGLPRDVYAKHRVRSVVLHDESEIFQYGEVWCSVCMV
jgi:hypothetical protein